jgi:hypothetical protein
MMGIVPILWILLEKLSYSSFASDGHYTKYLSGFYVPDNSMKVVFVIISEQQSPLSSRPKSSRHFSNRKKLRIPELNRSFRITGVTVAEKLTITQN